MTQWKPKQLEFKPMYEKHDELAKEVWFICDIPELGIEYDWEMKSKSVLVNTNPFTNAFVGHADTIEQANDLINADFGKRWQAMSEPQPFWKPIDQCPKVEGKKYDLYICTAYNGKIRFADCTFKENTWWCDWGMDISKYEHPITHYAEIPPLEVSK